MEKRILGKTGMEVSVLGFGGAEIGFQNATSATVGKLLSSALDAGLNVIDTAHAYAESEALIGQTVAHRRKDFYLFTKCGQGSSFSLPDWHPDVITKSIEQSLSRLRTDVLDLVQLHSCGRDVLEKGDAIAALQAARDAGKCRFIGYSGENEAAEYAVTCDGFDTLQTSVNVADQQCLDRTLPGARAANLGVIAKRPVANVAWTYKDEPVGQYAHEYWQRLQQLQYPLLNGSEPVGVALRFALSVPGVHTAIVGTQNPARWGQNAALLTAGMLPQSEFDAIRARWQEVAPANWNGQT